MTSIQLVLSTTIVFWIVVGFPSQSSAQDSKTSPVDSSPLRLFCYSNTIVAARIEFSKIQPLTAQETSAGDARLQAATKNLQQRSELLKQLAGSDDVYVFCDLPVSKAHPVVRAYFKDRSEAGFEALKQKLSLVGFPAPVRKGGFLGFSPTHSLQGVDDIAIAVAGDRPRRPEIDVALQTMAAFPTQLAIVPPDYLWRTLRELLPTLPQALGGGPSSVLTDGLQWAALGLNPANMQAKLIVQSSTPDAAKALADRLPDLLEKSLAHLPGRDVVDEKPLLRELAGKVSYQITGSRLEYRLDGQSSSAQAMQLLVAAAMRFGAPLTNQVKVDRLRQIGLALHEYVGAYGSLPPAKGARDLGSSSKLSWRVHILPFLGQLELYQRFRLDEAWDSPHNKALLDKMPDTYKFVSLGLLDPVAIQPGFTTIVAPVGKDTIFGQTEAVTFNDITDGSSNTVWLVELKLEHAVPWTAPLDYAYDPAAPLAKLQIGSNGKFLAARADGSTQYLPGDMTAEKILNLFQKSDGK